MIIVKRKQGFSLTEVLFALAVVGVILALTVGLVSNIGVKDTTLAVRQARLETVLATATKSILSDENLTATEACDATGMRDKYAQRLAGSHVIGDVKVNGNPLPSLRLQDDIILAFEASANCEAIWYSAALPDLNTEVTGTDTDECANEENKSAVVIYTSLNGADEINVPSSVTPNGSSADGEISSNVLAYKTSQTGLTITYSSVGTTGTMMASAAKNTSSSKQTPHDIGVCSGDYNAYSTKCVDSAGKPVYINYYETFDDASCTAATCSGNGYDANGDFKTLGKVNYMCYNGEGSTTQCTCPESKPYWANYWFGLYETPNSKEPVTGACVANCADFGMEYSEVSDQCFCPADYTWNADKQKCIKNGTCDEDYLKWDETSQQCICKTEAELKETYGEDYIKNCEIYDETKITEGCKRLRDNWEIVDGNCVCPSSFAETGNKCECLDPKIITIVDGKKYCECDKDLTLKKLEGEEIFSPGEGNCKFDCWYGTDTEGNPRHQKASADKTECVDPACGCFKLYEPATGSGESRTEGKCYCDASQFISTETCPINDDEKYDEQSATCKSCKSPNRVYNSDLVCECKPKDELNLNEYQIYDITKEDCIYTCEDGAKANTDYTECIGDCLEKYNYTTEKLECLKGSELTDEKIVECLKGTNYISNPNATDLKCKEECTTKNHVANDAHKQCVCDKPENIEYTDKHHKYDATAAKCESYCTSPDIAIRNPDKPTECVCPDEIPDKYHADAGYHYDVDAGIENKCQSVCPAGNYCPGDTEDPNPDRKINPEFTEGDVILCPCGTYGAETGLKTYECTAKCPAGKNCPEGTETPKDCSEGSICPEGVCNPQECRSPLEAKDGKTCECPDDESKIDVGKGYYYDANSKTYEPLCQSQCPDTADAITAWISGHGIYFTTNKTVYTSDEVNCINSCDIIKGKNYIANSTKTDCICGISKKDCVAGTHFDSLKCECVTCPAGSYCPGQDDDPNPTPTPNPNYPEGDVILCPCGTYGATQGLTSWTCSGKCDKGYYCFAGSTDKQQVACTAGYECPTEGLCAPTACKFPATSISPFESCSACLSQQEITEKEPTYFGLNEVWVNNINTACKTCKSNMRRDAQGVCHCPADTPYWDAIQNKCVECPIGSYCPSEEEKYDCPCGTYGSRINLKLVTECTDCPAGKNCPAGTDTPKDCSEGSICPKGVCKAINCPFPFTNDSDHKLCNVCRTEDIIRKNKPDYIGEDEIYSKDDVSLGCKRCKSNMEYKDEERTICGCPEDKPYWNGTECQECKVWGTLYFARQAESNPNCTLYDHMMGNKGACYDLKRNTADGMQEAAKALSSADRKRTFDGIYAYMISYDENTNQATVAGVFTSRSWYRTFEQDYSSVYTANGKQQAGTCSDMCNGNAECVETCEYFYGKVFATSMFDSCKYAIDNTFYGSTYNSSADEYCSGGTIELMSGCSYVVDGVMRKVTSPLVLDLMGNGFKYTSVDDGVIFDLDKDGIAEKTAWTKEQKKFDNAFLVLDKNKNGQVDNGGELFGDQNGSDNGFMELAKYDDNGDKVINANDKAYNELRLWVDFNKNAKVDYEADGSTKELKTLKEAGVTELSVDYNILKDKNGNILQDIYGNITGFIGSFKMMIEDAAGKLVEVARKMMDVFFVSR